MRHAAGAADMLVSDFTACHRTGADPLTSLRREEMARAAVIGRDEELASIEAFLAGVAESPAALILSGEPGIGKTLLWEAGVENAEDRHVRVLLHRSVAAEASLAFTGLSDLLADVFDEVAPSLLELRREVLEVALRRAKPGAIAPDPGAIGLALLDVIRALADPGPVVVALDDMQWLDASSASAVHLALRRLRYERIGLLATLRSGREVQPPFELDRTFAQARLERLRLGPLTLGALDRMLRDRIGLHLARPDLARVLEASGGNPFFALEMAGEIRRLDRRPGAGRLRVPESLHELLGGRLARLPSDAMDVLLHAAALARPTIDLVAGAHGDRQGVEEALEVASEHGVIALDDSSIRFQHPLLASIVYERAPPWRRRAVHQALAASVADLEERARHLALAAEGPDDAVACELEAAAEHAARRGATVAAAELCELAAELTPADPATARRRQLRAVDLHGLAGDHSRAVTLARRLRAEAEPGTELADVLLAMAATLNGGPGEMIALCDEALAQVPGDHSRCARILSFRTWANILAGDVDTALADAHAALERAERVGDPALVAAVIGRTAQPEWWSAKITPGLLERGVEIEDRLGLVPDYRTSPRVYLPRLYMRQGELARPRAMFHQLEEQASARGDEGTRLTVLWYLSALEWLAGRWQHAFDHAAAASELGEQIMHAHAARWAGRVRGLLETDLGLVDEARASVEAALAECEGTGDIWETLVIGVLGRLELVLGNLEAAGGYMRELPGRMLTAGINDPTQPIWGDAMEALVMLGELELAGSYLERYEEHAHALGSPWALGVAARCRGLLRAAQGDLTEARAEYERSLVELDAQSYPLERARSLLCLGSAQRQGKQKRPAREAFEQALQIFEELAARPWADKARAELRRVSGRQPSSDELTATERRVAVLAAQGRTNKEISAELFMGVSTVESHLTRVYRKLGVRSRTELATAVEPHGDARGDLAQT